MSRKVWLCVVVAAAVATVLCAAGMLGSAYVSQRRETARRVVAMENVRGIATAMTAYAEGGEVTFAELDVETRTRSSAAVEVGYGDVMVDAVEKARRLKCLNNLKQIGLTFLMYRQTHDDSLPRDLETLVKEKYLTDRKVFQCPSAHSPFGSVDYVMVKTEGRKFDAADIIVYDRKDNHKGGRNVLQYDGTTRWLSEEDFKNRMGNRPYE